MRIYGPGTGSLIDLSSRMMTFSLRQPMGLGHYRVVSCEEFGCRWHRDGFVIKVDETNPADRERAAYIRSGVHHRRYEEIHEYGTHVIRFVFAAGQQCFAEHRVPRDRPCRHVIRPGTARIPRGATRSVSPVQWHEELGENQLRVNELIKKGW